MKKYIMKKLSLYVFLVLMWCNVGFANDMGKIEDIKINGISIGDNLLDHFSKQTLIQNKELLSARTQSNKLYAWEKAPIPDNVDKKTKSLWNFFEDFEKQKEAITDI